MIPKWFQIFLIKYNYIAYLQYHFNHYLFSFVPHLSSTNIVYIPSKLFPPKWQNKRSSGVRFKIELNIERSKFQSVQFLSLSLSLLPLLLFTRKHATTPSMKPVRGRVQKLLHVSITSDTFSTRNVLSLAIDRAHAGKRIFERITCREGGFRRLEFRFQPRATRPQSRVICDDLEPVKVN